MKNKEKIMWLTNKSCHISTEVLSLIAQIKQQAVNSLQGGSKMAPIGQQGAARVQQVYRWIAVSRESQ